MAKIDLTQAELTTILQALDEAHYNSESLDDDAKQKDDYGRIKRYKSVFEKLKPKTKIIKNIYYLR